MPGGWRTNCRAFYIDQFNNAANPLAHRTTTAPELFEQLDGQIDAIVVGVGSGGTLGGLQAWFAEHSPQTEFVLADPAGSVLADGLKTDAITMPDRGWLRDWRRLYPSAGAHRRG